MAFVFLKLPSETRNQIYRYLLRDDDAYVYVVNQSLMDSASAKLDNLVTTKSPDKDTAIDAEEALTCLLDEAEPFRLHPEILSTCQQIHSEAMSILYGENVFFYAISESQFDDDIMLRQKSDLPRRALQRVRWLRVIVVEDDFIDWMEIKLLNGLGHFSSPECSLLGLRLEIQFFSRPTTARFDKPLLSQFFLHDTRFVSALLAFEDLARVRIYVCDDTMGSAGRYENGIQSIATKNNWRSTTATAMEHEHTEELYYWKWDLIPVVGNSLRTAQAPSLWNELYW